MKFGGIVMPIYQGFDKDGRHIVRELFQVDGVLEDGRVFEIMVAAGFIFDGASIPRALWRLCGHPMSVPRVAAALAHDWLYSAHVCDRAVADEIYRVLCKRVGISGFCAGTEYYTLRHFGGSAWKSHGENDEAFARARGMLVLEGEIQNGSQREVKEEIKKGTQE